MSSKPSKWLFGIIGGQHERNWREFSVAGFIFTYVQKYFPGRLIGGEVGDRPNRPAPWIQGRLRHINDGANAP